VRWELPPLVYVGWWAFVWDLRVLLFCTSEVKHWRMGRKEVKDIG
jgi:hypothetical protein